MPAKMRRTTICGIHAKHEWLTREAVNRVCRKPGLQMETEDWVKAFIQMMERSQVPPEVQVSVMDMGRWVVIRRLLGGK